jgi:hypothetical protein
VQEYLKRKSSLDGEGRRGIGKYEEYRRRRGRRRRNGEGGRGGNEGEGSVKEAKKNDKGLDDRKNIRKRR